MKKIDLGQAITILANIGVLAGIVALIVEIDQNSDHLALQLEFQANQKLFELNRELQDPVRAEIFAKAITNPDELSFGDGLVATTIVLNMINEWEERYWIERAGLTSQLGWKRHVQENIEWVLGSHFAIEAYKSNRGAYEDELVEYVDVLLDQVDPNGTSRWWTELQSSLQSGASEND